MSGLFQVSDTPMWTFTVGDERDIIRHSLIWAGTRLGGEVSHTLHKFQDQVKLQSTGVYWDLLPDSGDRWKTSIIQTGGCNLELSALRLLISLISSNREKS